MKKFILAAAVALMLSVPVMADNNVTVFSNGNEVADKGVILDGRTMVPVRGVFEHMGYTVDWNGDTKTATLTNAQTNTVIVLTNGKTSFTVNSKEITPDVPQQIVNSRFMLPLRAVGEAVDAKVDWNGETKTAYIDIEKDDNQNVEDAKKDDFETVTKTETIGNTTIKSEVFVPFISIDGVSSSDIPDDAVNEISID